MGVLNRLVGEQRKLYQAKSDPNYYFKDIEGKVRFQDIKDHHYEEIVYLRNMMKGSLDPAAFTGMIRDNVPLFNSAEGEELWGVIKLSKEELVNFILDDSHVPGVRLTALEVCDIVRNFPKPEAIEDERILEAIKKLEEFVEGSFLNSAGKYIWQKIYCSSLYLKIERMNKQGRDTSKLVNKKGNLVGFSKKGSFTQREFMKIISKGVKKAYGSPYVLTKPVKGVGKVTESLNKADGKLIIDLDIEQDKAEELKTMIENAGVATFYLGKKGLAFVERIEC